MRLFVIASGVIAVLGTAVGMAAPTAVPFITRELGLRASIVDSAPTWGQIRYAHVETNVRAGRTTRSAVVGRLEPGDSVRADFISGDWIAVFPIGHAVRDEGAARGYVYAPLLKEKPPSEDPVALR